MFAGCFITVFKIHEQEYVFTKKTTTTTVPCPGAKSFTGGLSKKKKKNPLSTLQTEILVP